MSIERNVTDDDNVFAFEQKDIVIPVGSTLNADGTIADPVDLTTFSDIEWTLRPARQRAAIIRKTVSAVPGGIVIEDAPAGTFAAGSHTNAAARIGLDSADTEELRAGGEFFHSLRELDGNNFLVHGSFKLQPARDPADPD